MLRAFQLPDRIPTCNDKGYRVSIALLAEDDFSDYLNFWFPSLSSLKYISYKKTFFQYYFYTQTI